MNKTAIKNFAIWARNKLIAEITYKAGLLGITEKEIKSPLQQSTQTVQFFDIGTKEPYSITGVEIEQRKKLVEEIQRKANQIDYKAAYQSVVEEVAYTWFNRLIAVRFMEVNDYLPTHLRVLSSESSNKSEPDFVTHAMDADLDYTPYEKDRIMQLKNDNQLDELFRMLFIKQCNALNAILPALFEKTNDYTELLMNVSFTDQDGVVYHLVNDISEDDFNVSKEGQVEIIGWMYQYYNTEPKDETFALLKKNVKITKERIPAATQLFTPDWIVRYMVENSLGRLWIEGHPNDALKSEWKYYLDEAEQEADVQVQLTAIREEYKSIKPEDIKVIDPCMGSGHILVYAFDVLMQIYESCGYSQRDAAKSIVEHNLYGLDIDNRAYQLAYFAVMMKAREYNRRILNGETDWHVYSIQESNNINRVHLKYFGVGMSDIEKNSALTQMQCLLDIMKDAKEYGSILNVDQLNWDLLYRFVRNVHFDGQMTLDAIGVDETQAKLRKLIEIAVVMVQKYDVVVTNPPYMGSSGMSAKLSEFVKESYPYSKSDLFAVFIERCRDYTKTDKFFAMITQPSFLFLLSFEKLRGAIIDSNTISSLLHMGRGIFGIDFGSTAFVVKKKQINNYIGCYFKLHERTFQYIDPEDIAKLYLMSKGNPTVKYDFSNYNTKTEDISLDEFSGKESQLYYETTQDAFSKIPGMPIAYWVSEKIGNIFSTSKLLKDVAEPKQGIATADNNKFLRLWFECANNNLFLDCSSHEESANSVCKWYPYNKGGNYRKWYGNNDYVINWGEDGRDLKNFKPSVLRNPTYYFRECISWSLISSGSIAFRYKPKGHLFDVAGMSCFANEDNIYYLLALNNSCLINQFMLVLAPTINYQVGNIANIPVIVNHQKKIAVDCIAKSNISISKLDWDSFEISWDFDTHPLIAYKYSAGYADIPMKQWSGNISSAFDNWTTATEAQFKQLKVNEEEFNRIFIDIYGLQDELTPEVEDKDVTIRKADLGRDIRSFISYAVGCMFGRYSLDVNGLAYAGGEWDDDKYSSFIPDKDNILPITDEAYFEDDVVGLFCAFVSKTFGTETLEENLDFIAKALGNRGNSSREIIRNYFLKDFFKDHGKIYQKRPIYWLFDSGKADGFKALVYMHRYNEDTIGNLRIDYLHRMQRVYESEISRMQETIDNSKDAREVSAATKRKEKLVKQLKETKEYDEKIAHLALARIDIDLDDGVKVNYEKVQTCTDGKKLQVLAEI